MCDRSVGSADHRLRSSEWIVALADVVRCGATWGCHPPRTAFCLLGAPPVGGMAPHGLYGTRCTFNSAITKLRHDTIEMQLTETIRGGVGIAYPQQHNLPAAERTVPDLVIYLGNKVYLCDETVIGTLAESNLAVASRGPSVLANAAAKKKVDKYRAVAAAAGVMRLRLAIIWSTPSPSPSSAAMVKRCR